MKKYLLLLLPLCLLLPGCGAGNTIRFKMIAELNQEEFCVAFRKDDPLCDIFTAALKELSADGQISRLSAQYLGTDYTCMEALPGALRGYKELNLRCMKLVEPGGFLVSCSCSQFMTPELFFSMLREAAHDAGRDARLLELLMQSRDHPAALSSDHSLYLKGYILQIF